jgi:hypothetical protein
MDTVSGDDQEDLPWVYTTTQGNIVSFLEPSVLRGRGIPPEAIVGRLLVPPERRTPTLRPDEIQINHGFVDFLHHVVATHAPSSAEMQALAQEHKDGWIYLIDARTATPQGEVPAHDIIGAFEVQDRRIVADSYQRMEHQIVTERGIFRLPRDLQICLLQELERLTLGDGTPD